MYTFKDNEYTKEQLQNVAAQKGYTFDELLDKNPEIEKPGKKQPTTQKGAEPVDVIEAPDTESKSEVGSSGFTEKGEIVLTGTQFDEDSWAITPVPLEEVVVEADSRKTIEAKNWLKVAEEFKQAGIPEMEKRDMGELKPITPFEETQRISESELERRKKAPKKPKTLSESIANTTGQAMNRLAQVDDYGQYLYHMVLSDTDIVYNLFGEEFGNKVLKQNRVELGKTEAKLKKYASLTKPAFGFTDISKDKSVGENIMYGAGAFINAFSNVGTSIALSATTGGAALGVEIIGQTIAEHNRIQADTKKINLDQLASNGEFEVFTPLSIGFLRLKLEQIGLDKMSKAMLGANPNLLKRFVDYGISYGVNFAQENIDVGLEELNKGLAQGLSDTEAANKAVKFMLSKEGIEAGLQGGFGATGFSLAGAGLKAAANIRTKDEQAYITKATSEIARLEKSKMKKGLTEDQIQIITDRQNNLIKKVKASVVKNNKIVFSLTDSQLEGINKYTEVLQNTSKNIKDIQENKNLDEETKASMIEELNEKAQGAQNAIGNIRKVAEKISQGIDKTKQAAKYIDNLEILDFENTEKINEYLKSKGLSKKYSKNSDQHGFIIQDPITNKQTIVINKDVSTSDLAINVANHEFTHALLFKALKDNPETAIALGEALESELDKIDENQVKNSEFKLRLEQYKQDKIVGKVAAAEETLTLFSDALKTGDLAVPTDFLDDSIRSLLSTFGVKTKFDEGSDVINFIRDLNSSLDKGTLTKEQIKISKGEVSGKLIKKPKKQQETKQTAKLSKATGEQIQKIYEDKGVAGAMEIIEAYKPLTTKITNKYRDVPGFDFELLQSEIEIGQRGLLDLIQAYTPDRGATLNTYVQGQLERRAIEAANRILDTEFTLDVTEAKGVTDTTTEEVTERIEEDKPAERVSLRKQLGLDETIKPTVVNAVKKTFGTRLPEVTSPKFRPELEKRFRTELKKPLAKLMGRTEDYRSFLSNNFEVLYNAIPQTVINKRFNEFAEPVLDKDGKPAREKTAVGKGIFKKKKIVKAEWIKYFLGDNVGRSTQGTRKTALAEALAEQFAFDATMEVLADPQVIGKVKEIGELIQQPVPENMVEQVSDMLERPLQFKFSLRLESFEGSEKVESALDRFFRIVEKEDRIGNEKTLNAFLRMKGVDGLYNIKNEEGLQEFYNDFIKYILPNVPKGLLFTNDPSIAPTSNMFNRSGSSFREIGFSAKEKQDGTRDRIGKLYKGIIKEFYNFNNFGSNVEGIANYRLYHPKNTIGSTEEKIAEFSKNEEKVKEFNDRNGKIHKTVWKNLANAIEADSSGRALRAVAMFMQFSTNNMTHFHKMGAEYIGYSMNAKGAGKKLYEWEHAMPSLGAAIYLMDSAFDKSRDFDTDYKAVMSNYKLIALDNADNVKLNSTYLKEQMPVGWKVFSGSYLQRYFNSMLAKVDGGIDPSSIMLTNGKTIKQEFRIEADGRIYDVKPEPLVKESKKLDTEFNQLLQATTGIEYYKEFSPAKARLIGRGKGKRKFFIPYSADDFVGLLYATLGKGKVGDKQMAWYEENLLRPFSRGIQQYEAAKQKAMREWMVLSSQIKKDVPGGLNKRNDTGFRNQDSLRMYIWAKQGMDVPGAAKSDVSDAVALVNNNPKLKEFAEKLIALNPEGYPAPGQSWDAGDITTDIVSYVNDVRRGEFLTEWKENVDQIFTDKNKQKLLALYGQNYIDALEDMLHRMKTGRNRKFGTTKAERAFMDWTNNSVGAIMFFNARSAVLQTLSAVNFINFSDNNPINAGLAFANQPQYWKDFATLFNSDFLKQRRSGLQTDVNADEIANAAKSSTNKAKAALSAILKLGFTPTQIADSFAIASGGATFYRNRVKKYIKEGLDKEAAEKKAFTDFQEVAEETQQSARPDRISSQQASSLGRLVLAFGNTPMQYARLTKKATLDLINGRGDWKTNISKIAYYSVIQNIIFSALQQGLFALLFDEEDDEKTKSRYFRIGNSSIDTLLRGSGVYGAAAATVKNMILEIIEQSEKSRPDYTKVAMEATTLSPPINSKLRKLESAGKTFTYKQSKEKVFTEGFSFENPAFLAGGRAISAVTNLPVDRVVQKADHIHTAMQDETELWQAIALSLGWSEWDLNMIEKQTKSSSTPTRGRSRSRSRNRSRNRKRN